MNTSNHRKRPVEARASVRSLRIHRALALGLIAATCGCAHTMEGSLVRNHLAAKRAVAATQPTSTRLVADQAPVGVARQARISDTASPQQLSTPKVAGTSKNASPSANAPAAGAVVPVSYDQPLAGAPVEAYAPPDAVVCQPGQAAVASEGAVDCQPACNSGCVSEVPCGPLGEPVVQYWNDQEYIYDGGDREPRVQVSEEWRVNGLNGQDTIAHYETLEGKICVSPSNRVPIYAPRFGAVRKSTAPILSAGAVGARGMLDPQGAVVKASHEPAGDIARPEGPRLRDAIAPIDSLRDRTRGVGAEKILPPIDLSSYQMALRRLQSEGPSLRREDLLALLGEYMVNARTWTSPEGLSVAISGVVAAQVRDAKEVQDITVYETEPGKCSLRICKAASHSAANPGDIISFTIRFENIGSKPIGNLVILDSLTTRLEYIDGSQQCILSLASNKTPDKEKNLIKFSTAENDVGSTVLRWESDSPLETADSGVITFRCRVR